MNYTEVIVFAIYLMFMIGIGVVFFVKQRNGDEKTFFLGGRQMGPWVAALSAGASDMSAWVLMGLPAGIYAYGTGQVWIPVGLAIGYAISWIAVAPRLRRFSIVAKDSITIPQYLTNRFLSKSRALQVLCAVVFLVAYTVYAASSIVACGKLFHVVIGIDQTLAMLIAALIIVGYTFLGGFSAVCWTDFFQGMLIFGAMLIAPIFAATMLDNTAVNVVTDATYWDPFVNWKDIVSGLAWGLGYFGMPHIIVRFMSIGSAKSMKKSATIGITWTVVVVVCAAFIGVIGRMFLGFDQYIADNELVFINMVRTIFPSLVSGILLSAILAASMSTADSQLLAASSAFASDVYKPIFRKNKASDKEMMWAGRLVILAVAVVALLIALAPGTKSIMSLVENAWGLFGAAFGPTIILSLFWKRFNFKGAVAGIVTGAVVDIAWLVFLNDGLGLLQLENPVGIYEILPGFVCGLIAAIVTTLCTKKPSADVEKLFDDAINYAE